MDFEQRLKNAIEQGKRKQEQAERAQRAKELTEQEIRQRHSELRLQMSEYIEECMQKIPNHVMGFQYETIFGDRGWGAACYRDDFGTSGGRRNNLYSRLELTVRPMSKYPVLEIGAKGTIRNRELFTRNHFEDLDQVDIAHFKELVDVWIIEFVELYTSKN